MLHLAENAESRPAMASFLGILYAEDFDDQQPAASPATEPEPDRAPPLTPKDVEAACAHAVANARVEWEAGAAEKRLDLLGAIRSALSDARAEAEKVALEAAEAAVATILTALTGALPKLCAEHGPNEVRALLDRLLPMLRAEPRITIRVHADLVAALRQQMIDVQSEFAGVIVVNAAPIGRGDVRVTWDNGSLVRDTSQIQQAIHAALSQLGLLGPVETSPKRSLAYAE